jgi:hypothetical protein
MFLATATFVLGVGECRRTVMLMIEDWVLRMIVYLNGLVGSTLFLHSFFEKG